MQAASKVQIDHATGPPPPSPTLGVSALPMAPGSGIRNQKLHRNRCGVRDGEQGFPDVLLPACLDVGDMDEDSCCSKQQHESDPLGPCPSVTWAPPLLCSQILRRLQCKGLIGSLSPKLGCELPDLGPQGSPAYHGSLSSQHGVCTGIRSGSLIITG